MNKIVILVLLFMFIFVSVGFASQEEEKTKINNEIRRLTVKLKTSKVKSHRVKIQKLILKYKQRLARIQEEELLSQSGMNKYALEGRVASLGFGGGGALLSLGYQKLGGPALLRGGVGYGLGSNYSILEAKAGLGYIISGKNYVALDLTYASYSKKIEGVLGVSGNLGAGGSIGVGIIYGHKINNLLAEIGYVTNLGVMAKLGILF